MGIVARMGRIFHPKFRCIVGRRGGDNKRDSGFHIFRRSCNSVFFVCFQNCGFETNCASATKSCGFGTTDGGSGKTDRGFATIGYGFGTTDRLSGSTAHGSGTTDRGYGTTSRGSGTLNPHQFFPSVYNPFCFKSNPCDVGRSPFCVKTTRGGGMLPAIWRGALFFFVLGLLRITRVVIAKIKIPAAPGH